MACYSMRLPNEDAATRERRLNDALARVEAALAAGTARIVIGPGGAAAIEGWTQDQRERGGALLPGGTKYVGGLTDVCAMRSLMLKGSAVARQAIAEAERVAHQRFNPMAAVHSHDGGVTWGGH